MNEKLKARRLRIFAALDEMKQRGERISAQKLAAVVNMGKQTVLPLYREWQELEAIGVAEDVSLSDELTRVIKRELAREKFHQGEQLRKSQESLDDFHTEFENMQASWLSEQGRLIEEKNEINNQLQTVSEQLSQTKIELTELSEQHGELKHSKILVENQRNELRELLKKTEEQSRQTLEVQEKRLDSAHQKILDHWLTVVDSERRGKDKAQTSYEIASKELLQLQHKQHETTLSLKEARAEAERGRETLKELEAVNSELKVNRAEKEVVYRLLGSPEYAAEAIEHLMADKKDLTGRLVVQEYEGLRLNKVLADKEGEVRKLQSLTCHNQELEKENIRLEAYIQGLKASSATED